MLACIGQNGTSLGDGFNAVAMGSDGSSVLAGEGNVGPTPSAVVPLFTGNLI